MSAINNIYYTASLVEFIGRATKNHRKTVVETIGEKRLENLIYDAEVNHCLSFEQVSDEVIDWCGIQSGDYDSVAACEYKVPSHTAIGQVYARLVQDTESDPALYGKALYQVFTSPISEELSDFNSPLFYASSSQIAYEYQQMKHRLQ